MAQETITAPLPGKLLSVSVKTGDQVEEGGVICTIESMKMEVPILTPVAGTVKEVHITPEAGQILTTGQLIAVIEY